MSAGLGAGEANLIERIEYLTKLLKNGFKGKAIQGSSRSDQLQPAANATQSAEHSIIHQALQESIEPNCSARTAGTELCQSELERDQLKVKCSEAEQRIAELEATLNRLQTVEQANRSLECRLERKAWDLENMEASKQESQKLSDELLQDNRLLKAQLDVLERQCRESNEAAQQARASADIKEKQRQDLANRCEAQREALNGNVQSLEEKASMELQLRETVHQLTDLGQSLESQLECKTRAQAGLEENSTKLHQENQRLNAEVEKLNRQCRESSEAARQALAKADSVANELEGLKFKFKAQLHALNQSEQELVRKTHLFRNLRETIAELTDRLRCQTSSQFKTQCTENELKELMMACQAQTATLNQCEQARQSLESQLECKTLALEELEESKQKLQEDSMRLHQDNQRLKSQEDVMKRLCQERNVAAQQAIGNADRMANEIGDLKTKLGIQLQALNKSEQALEGKTHLERNLRETISELTDRLRREADLRQSLESQLECKTRALAGLEATRQKLQEDSTKLLEENQLLKAQVKNLNKKCRESSEAAREALAKSDSMANELEGLKSKFEAQLHALNQSEQALEGKTHLERNLRETIAELSDRLRRHADESDYKLSESMRTQDQLYRKWCEQSNLRRRVEVQQNRRITILEQRLEHRQTELEEAQEKLCKTAQQLESTEQELASKVQSYSELEMYVVIHLAELLVGEFEADEHSMRVNELNVQLMQVHEQLKQSEETVLTYKCELVSADTDLVRLKAERDELGLRVSSLLEKCDSVINQHSKSAQRSLPNLELDDLQSTQAIQLLTRANETQLQSKKLADDLRKETDGFKVFLQDGSNKRDERTRRHSSLHQRLCEELRQSASIKSELQQLKSVHSRLQATRRVCACQGGPEVD